MSEKCKTCVYSRAIGQPSPRLCTHCGQPESFMAAATKAFANAIPWSGPIKDQVTEAQAIFDAMVATETAMVRNYAALFADNWRLGEKLHALKEQIGHGKWELWRTAHFPDLEENKAKRSMAFYRANESANRSNLTDLDAFTVDSRRALMGGYIPAKLRPQLEGDQKLTPPAHHFGFVSSLTKWDRQLNLQLIAEPDADVMRAELAPAVLILKKRLGADWLRQLLDAEE